MVRAKFRVCRITKSTDYPGASVIELKPVSADEVPENQRFHKWTPAGSMTLHVNNPSAAEQLTLGDDFYVDFTPAAAPDPSEE